MADLDNFFAKKDRKKSKGKKFATSTDNMATSQEELQKKQEKQKKERTLIQQNYSNENDSKSNMKLEEEWMDYTEEIKDYTTLKMQNLTTDSISNCSDYNDKDSDIEFEKNEVGEMVPKRKNTGPWKVPEIESTPTPKVPDPVVQEKDVKVENSVYVAPAHRNNFRGGNRSAPRSKTSLDVKNEEMFPTLQANSTKKTVIAPGKKPETAAWSNK
ncbi:Protein CDV3 [Cinara cedri]|uniref:Protein CDV3 n=1 Tax=Cinara cedri TaxID=506608 RepID=A0A5E4NEN5_9HEMI|nr:Protein CDV3 [Cinara cedri]